MSGNRTRGQKPKGTQSLPVPRSAAHEPTVLQTALAVVVNGLNLDTAETAIGDMVEAIKAQAAALATADWSGMDPDKVARAIKQTGDTLDTTLRLTAFATGNPDSRAEITGGRDWLSRLTDEQLAIVEGWLRAHEGGKA